VRKHLWMYISVLMAVASLFVGCSLSGSAVPATGLSVSPQTATINTRTGPWTLQLAAAVTPPEATDQHVMWLSTDTSKATVDANGLVTAAPNQSSIVFIIAEIASGPHVVTCTITLN
jgi:uncharacterized protein YjdB